MTTNSGSWSRRNWRQFFRRQDFTGVNVTIPYKQAVIPLLDELSETAVPSAR